MDKPARAINLDTGEPVESPAFILNARFIVLGKESALQLKAELRSLYDNMKAGGAEPVDLDADVLAPGLLTLDLNGAGIQLQELKEIVATLEMQDLFKQALVQSALVAKAVDADADNGAPRGGLSLPKGGPAM